MKILILRFSSIGDIVLTTPVVRCIKKQISDAEIHFATKKQFSALVENNPYITKYHLLEKSLSKLIRELRRENFDLIVDLHRNLRTLRVKTALHTKSVSYEKLNFQKWIAVNFKKISILPKKHIVDRYLETVISIGVRNDYQGLDYFLPENFEYSIDKLPKLYQHGYYVFALGGQHATKRLPEVKMKELCEACPAPLLVIGGKEDESAGIFLQKTYPEKVLNLAGKLSLNESAFILSKSSLVYTHDTGMMHIAAAFKKPIVSFWGNTIPEFGMYPYYPENKVPKESTILQVTGLRCRPCSKIGFNKCPKGHFDCMNRIELKSLI